MKALLQESITRAKLAKVKSEALGLRGILSEGNCYELAVRYLSTNWADVNSVEEYYEEKETATDDEVAVVNATIEVVNEDCPNWIGRDWLREYIHDIAQHYAEHNDLVLY